MRRLRMEYNHDRITNCLRVSRIMCDPRISSNGKGEVHNTVVRPAVMHGAETKNAQEK